MVLTLHYLSITRQSYKEFLIPQTILIQMLNKSFTTMSKEKFNEEQVNETTSQATENENMVEISAKELNELRESNANLIAERESLMEKVSTLEKKLKEEQESASRLRNYWRQEEEKVATLKQIVRSLPINSYLSAKELLNAMVENF